MNLSSSYMNFIAMGSGSVAAIGILERDFKSGMTLEEGKALVTKAISAGIIHDLGSGSQVDIAVITKDSTDFQRNVLTIGKRETKKREYHFEENNIGKPDFNPNSRKLTQLSYSWKPDHRHKDHERERPQPCSYCEG